MSPSRVRVALAAVLGGAAALYFVGLGWGVPSAGRAEAVLSEGQRDDAFYRDLEDNRRALYARIGPNLQASFARGTWSGSLLDPTTGFELIRTPAGLPPEHVFKHAYSSFLLRSVDQDEQGTLNVLSRFRPKQLDFRPSLTQVGGAYIYPMAGLMAGLHVAGALRLVPDPLFYYREPSQLGRLYVAGRLQSALAALGAVFLLFLLGRELFDEKTGLWAAALFATTPVVVAFAHLLKGQMTVTLFSMACLLYCARAATAGRRPDFLKAAAFFGLAMGAQKYALPLCTAVVAAYLYGHPDRFTWRGLRFLVSLGLLSVAAFLVTNPYTFTSWRDAIDESRGMVRWYESALNPRAVWNFAVHSMRGGLGTPAWLLAAGSAVWALARGGRKERMLLAFALPALVWTAFQMNSQSALPITFRFYVFGAALFLLLGARAALSVPLGGAALALLLSVNVARAVGYDVNFLRDYPGRSNAFQAGRWIEENVPAGDSIGFDTPAPMVDRFPPFRFARYDMVYAKGPVPPERVKELPRWYVGRDPWGLPPDLSGRYEKVRVFDDARWLGRPFREPFTSANFPVAVYALKPVQGAAASSRR